MSSKNNSPIENTNYLSYYVDCCMVNSIGNFRELPADNTANGDLIRNKFIINLTEYK